MDLDPECPHQVEKKYSSEEDKRVEKLCLPNKSNRLKKRSEFISLRNKCLTLHGKFIIVNNSSSSSEEGNRCELIIKLWLVSLRAEDSCLIVLFIDGSS